VIAATIDRAPAKFFKKISVARKAITSSAAEKRACAPQNRLRQSVPQSMTSLRYGGSIEQQTPLAPRLRELPDMLAKVAHNVELSKARDDERGSRIMDDYTQVHTEAKRDLFVRQTWEQTTGFQREIEELLLRLEQDRSSSNRLSQHKLYLQEVPAAFSQE
jgi:hypothetical protein